MNIKQLPFAPMNEIHENEVKLLNQLLNTIKQKKDVSYIYKFFLDDVKLHFEFEENLMEKYNFFAIVPHKMEHNRILRELENIKQIKLEDYQFLDEYFNKIFIPWLENHINTIDTVTAGYLALMENKEEN